MSMDCAFSIVIPTRNRVHTLSSTLQTCLGQMHFDNYEIVVNDNSDGEETRDFIGALIAENPRAREKIRYHRRSTVCSMADNFEDAISRASGEYIIVVGDDDGIMPMALYELNEIIVETGASVVKWRNGLYTWPDIAIEGSANYLGFSLRRSWRKLDGREELRNSLEELNYENLPMLYINAAVHSALVKAIRDNEGGLFRSRSPDVYSAIVLGYRCGQFLDLTVPLTLAGLSSSSNGVSTAFAGENRTPNLDFEALNAQAGIVAQPTVPNLAIHPVRDFAESFLFAKSYHFSADDEFQLSRRRMMRKFIQHSDLSVPAVRDALLNACADDEHLRAYAQDLMVQTAPGGPIANLRPANLGADGINIHLDGRDFGITDIAGAVQLVHTMIWPLGARLRYDL